MRIDLTDGILIEGNPDELRDLAGDLESVADDGGTFEATFLTDDGVHRFVIRLAEDKGGQDAA